MPSLHLPPVPLTLLAATLVPERPWRPSPDLSLTLRSALGNAAFEVACVQDDRDCPACRHRVTCAIPTWYDPGRLGSHRGRPYALLAAAEDDGLADRERPLHVWMTLLGPLPRPTLLLESLMRAVRGGLGRERAPHVVSRLVAEGDGAPTLVIVDDAVVGTWPHPTTLSRATRLPDGVPIRVELVTPLVPPRSAGRAEPPPWAILDLALGRVRAVAREQGVTTPHRWPDPRACEGEWLALEWVDRSRWSQRQGERLDLSGWMGVVAFGADVEPFLDLLAAAELLHVGRHVSAGAGKVAIT